MKKYLLTILSFCLFFSLVSAIALPQRVSAQPVTWQLLYSQGAPDSNGLTAADMKDNGSNRTLAHEADYALFMPDKDKATGQAVVILPGGAYHSVAYRHEGLQVAEWMTEQGLVALVLRYRMPNGHYEVPLNDVHAAIRLLKAGASQYNIDPGKVGVIGFSAGGHLASTASTTYDADTRPAFSILVYPVITMNEKYTHLQSRQNLTGQRYNAALVERYSSENRVTPDTPPTFMVFSHNDDAVPTMNGILYYNALRENNVPAEFHIYPSGKHGWGWNQRNFDNFEEMTASLARWLRDRNNDNIRP